MLRVLERFRNELYWIIGTIGLTVVWLGFVYLFRPDGLGTFATAIATA